MRKNNLFSKIKHNYFNESLNFRAQIFNVLGLLGCALGLFLSIYSIVNFTGVWSVLGNVCAAIAAVVLIIAANRTKAFKLFFLITVTVVFLILFPVLFFSGGGYKSSMPCFFVFAIVFTVLMLEGWQRTVFTLFEFALYLGCFLMAFLHPETIINFPTETALAADVIVGCLLASLVLALAILRHIIIYDQKHKELEKANDTLHGFNRMKTEFLSNTSHEMRTPLTVISVNVQTVIDILEDLSIENADAEMLLSNAQGEVMRLTRMVEGMLTLASMSESTDKHTIDFSALLHSSADMMRLSIGKRGNNLKTEVEPGLKIFGNADLLAQVITNLLQNAGAHTENGIVSLTASKSGNEITVKVRDTGTGIPTDILPYAFERGVSDGGTGFGLYLCKTVVESHGGHIWLESELGHGATAAFILPLYEGQFGGGEV